MFSVQKFSYFYVLFDLVAISQSLNLAKFPDTAPLIKAHFPVSLPSNAAPKFLWELKPL